MTGEQMIDDGLGDQVLRILEWHDPSHRRLPWRDTTDPYGVLVSEVMSQQTQAARAGRQWEVFMGLFPTVADLASASPAQVIAAWVGLGYNRRAVNLHRAALAMVASHGGEVPDTLSELLELPGVGPYTARAVLAFAFRRDVVPVDTNVARVLARLHGSVLGRVDAQALADRTAQYGTGPAIAAALMDLGASTCTSRVPDCSACPVVAGCSWAGGPTADPAGSGAHRPVRQSRFSGSARQARGRVVAALRDGPMTTEDGLRIAGSHGGVLLDKLLSDGLIAQTDDGFALPS